jgi:hypothetical protein
MKKKPVELWPAYESPERIRYDDRPELPEDVYKNAGRHFTREAFEQVKAALDPPKNFDLLKRLRRAVYDYHLFAAAQDGKNDLIPANPREAQGRAFDGLIAQTRAYLEFCEANLGAFLSVEAPPEGWLFLLALLADFKRKAEAARQQIKLNKTGPARDIARRAYQTYLLKFYEEARRAPMTSRTNSYYLHLKKAYGPAFDFFSAAFLLVGLNLAPNSINTYLKATIRKRDKITTSKLFTK